MVAAHRTKTVDKQEVCRRILVLLKKSYSTAGLKPELPVLETLLYAVCLENSSPQQADQVYARLLNSFHDLNEIRVSSIYELENLFFDAGDPEWRALRVKNVLQYIFETNYSFDFEGLKRKTHDLAVKQLGKIKNLSPFVRAFVVQNTLGSHALPLDDRMLSTLQWMGLAEPTTTVDHAADALRSFVRKADAQLFCYLLRCLATDPRMISLISKSRNNPAADDGSEAYERLEFFFKHPGKTLPVKAQPVKKEKESKESKAKAPPPKAAPAKHESPAARSKNGAAKSEPRKAAVKSNKPAARKPAKPVSVSKAAARPQRKKSK